MGPVTFLDQVSLGHAWDLLRFWIKAGQLGPCVGPVMFLDQSRSVGALHGTRYIFGSKQVSWFPLMGPVTFLNQVSLGHVWDLLRFWIKASQLQPCMGPVMFLDQSRSVGALRGSGLVFGSRQVSWGHA